MIRRPPQPLLLAALLLAGGGAVIASRAVGDEGDGAPRASLAGPPRAVNERAGDRLDISAHNSPTVARNPARSANLVVANRIDTPRFACGLHISFDGGTRWSDRPIAIPAGEEPKCYAPDVAFASDGTLYLSFVTLRGVGNVPHAAWIARSTDGGRTLSRPRRVLGPLSFQVRLTVDPADPRRLYLTWLEAADVGLFRFTSGGNPIRVTRSDDRGATWERPATVSSEDRARVVAPSAAIGPNGEVYVLYLDLGEDRLDYEGGHEGLGGRPYPGAFQLVLARSEDEGATWAESVVEREIVPSERFLAFLPPFPSVAVDRRSGRVYAGFHDGRRGRPDVLVWSLPRDGSRWEGPTRVNDTPARDGTSQYLPKLAVAPDGRLDVVYYDRRSDRRDVMNEVSLQSSFDDGASFTKRVRLSDRPFDSRIGFGSGRGLPDLGNRLGLTSDDSQALAVWSDTRSGTVTSNKQDLASARVAYRAEAEGSQPLRYLLLWGGLTLALVAIGMALGGIRRPRSRSSVTRRGHP